jgi:hypothetical protein
VQLLTERDNFRGTADMASVSLEQVADLLRGAMSPSPDIRSEAERMLEGTVRGALFPRFVHAVHRSSPIQPRNHHRAPPSSIAIEHVAP